MKLVRRKIALSEKCNWTTREKCDNKTIGVCFEEQKNIMLWNLKCRNIKLKIPMIFVKVGFCIARKCPLQILQTCSQV